MRHKNPITILVVFMLLLSAGGALVGTAGAAELHETDGTAVDSADETDTIYIATGSDLGNFTVDMTEDQTIADGGSLVYNTNLTAASATVNTSSGSGTASVTVNDGNVTVSETGGGANSVTVESLHVTFNVSDDPSTDGSLADAVNVSDENWMKSEADLIQDDDDSENATYLVYDPGRVLDVSYAYEDANVTVNTSDNEIQADGTDTEGTLVVTATRNLSEDLDYDTVYEGIPMDSLKLELALNTTYFSDISEDTTEKADRIALEDVKSEDGQKVFTWDISQADNTTRTYELRVDAMAEAGDVNETLTSTQRMDPTGGVQVDNDRTFDHALSSSVVLTSPNFWDIGESPLIAGVIGLIVVMVILYVLMRYRDENMSFSGYGAHAGAGSWKADLTSPWAVAWLIALVVGLSMVADAVFDSFVQFDFWTNLLEGSLSVLNVFETSTSVILYGVVFLAIALVTVYRNSSPMRG